MDSRQGSLKARLKARLQAALRHSLHWRLACALALAICLTALAAGALSAWRAWHAAQEQQDRLLLQAAALIHHPPETAVLLGDDGEYERPKHDGDEIDSDSEDLLVQPLPARPSDIALPLEPRLRDGLHTLRLQGRGWRVLIKTLPDKQRLAVAQTTRARQKAALHGARLAVLPLLALVPLLLLVATALTHRMLRPLTRLARQIDERPSADLTPLPTQGLPTEIAPFAAAINRLLARVELSVAQQRRFVADAAHELRTPLTALSLQAERLSALPLPPEAAQRLHELRQGMERNRHLLNQLLSLARAQSQGAGPATAPNTTPNTQPAAPAPPVAVRALYLRLLEDMLPLAEEKQLDIGLIEGPELHIPAPEWALHTLLRNLIDNAIRYTPAGGRIDLSATARPGGPLVLEVQDSGPGIAAHERQRVLDPFYRVLGNEQQGSGLGLSIAHTLAQGMGGTLELLDAPTGPHGLLARLTLPAAAPPDLPID